MSTRWKWVIAFAAACLLALPAKAEENGPSYQGHTFAEWASQIDFTVPIFGEDPPPVAAIRHIGTNGIPILLSWISDQKFPKGMTNQAYKPPTWYSPSRVEAAAMLFLYLGDGGKPAIPELTRFALKFKDRERYDECVRALAYIGPSSVPAFETILTKGRPGVQFSALEWMPALGTNSVTLMPAVLQCMIGKGQDDEVADKAVAYFEDSAIPQSITVPALTNALSHASTKGRLRICRCFYFMSYGKPAADQPWAAVPALVRVALKDPNAEVSNTASNALESIETSRPR